MAKLNPDKATTIALGFVIVVIMFAFLIPIAISEVEGPEEFTVDQNESQTVLLQPTLNATLDDVDDANDEVDVTFGDTETNETVSVTGVAVGANKTATIGGETVRVNNTANINTSAATLTYESPESYSWSEGAASIYGIYGLMLVLVAFMLIIAEVSGVTNFI